MALHLPTKIFCAVSMRREDCTVCRETDYLSELLYQKRFTGSNIFIEYTSRPPMDGQNHLKAYWLHIYLSWFLVSCFLCVVPTFYNPYVKTI